MLGTLIKKHKQVRTKQVYSDSYFDLCFHGRPKLTNYMIIKYKLSKLNKKFNQ